ncbi:MAG: response regulator [Caulobacterales bacterium]
MDIRDWNIALIEPNKWDAQIQIDLLKAAGVTKLRRFKDSAEALEALELFPANIVIMEFDCPPLNGVEWTKQFRRGHHLANRKAPVFQLSHAVSRQLAENCRHAGANAIIGKPLSSATLISTIKKVLANPRPFIDAENYVGPCRRAGIVTAGMSRTRRKSDSDAPVMSMQDALADLPRAVTALASATGELLRGKTTSPLACRDAFKSLMAIVKSAQDEALMRACAGFASQLESDPRKENYKPALAQRMDHLAKCAAITIDQRGAREALAKNVAQAVKSAAA